MILPYLALQDTSQSTQERQSTLLYTLLLEAHQPQEKQCQQEIIFKQAIGMHQQIFV